MPDIKEVKEIARKVYNEFMCEEINELEHRAEKILENCDMERIAADITELMAENRQSAALLVALLVELIKER